MLPAPMKNVEFVSGDFLSVVRFYLFLPILGEISAKLAPGQSFKSSLVSW